MRQDGLCSWLMSSGGYGFVRVDDQFRNSPFYSGAAWLVFFGGCMACPFFVFSSFSPILYEEKLQLFADISGRFSAWWVCGKHKHCCCIFITDIICVEKGKDVCIPGEEVEITWSPV